MAFGPTPQYTREYHLEQMSITQFFRLIKEAADILGWSVNIASGNEIIVYVHHANNKWNRQIDISVESGIATIRSRSTDNQLIDWGKNKEGVTLLLNTIEDLTYEHGLQDEDNEELYNTLYDPVETDNTNTLPPTQNEQVSHPLSFLLPSRGYLITPILLYLNTLVFIAMAVSGVNILQPDTQSLLNWGANFVPLTTEGQWWRLITSFFIHIGIMHLVMNMYALVFIGILLEQYLGPIRFLVAYIICGIVSSVSSLYWNDMVASAGASGAIFGMYGVFLSLIITNPLERSARKPLLVSIIIFVAYNLLAGLRQYSGIDNAGHIGGLVCGFIIGLAYIPAVKKPELRILRILTPAVASVALFISTFFLYKNIPNDLPQYEKEMKNFVVLEALALEVFDLRAEATKQEILYDLKDRGIYYWNENIKLIDGINKLHIPPPLKQRNEILKHYCNLRIQSYNLLYKSVEEENDAYKDEIVEIQKEIDKIIKDLKGE